MNNKYIIWIVVIVLVLVAGLYFFTNQNSSYVTPNPVDNGSPVSKIPPPQPVQMNIPNPPTTQVIHNVSISNFAFVPATITVRKGETIVWTNKDAMAHTVTGGDLNSAPLAQNQTYSFTYDKTGTFPYHCSIHPSMKGTIIVTD